METPRNTLTLAAAALALCAVSACKPKDRAAADTALAHNDTTAMAPAAANDSTAMAHDSTNPNVTHSGWTDAQILAYARAANNGEINEGKLAEKKATNAEVKAFARQMVADHEKMLLTGREFATKHKITPDTTKNDVGDLAKDSRDEVKDLTDKKAGADWDKEFLDKQIDGHKKVLSNLQDAAKATTDTALAGVLTKAAGKVQEHLTKAQALKDKYPAS
jgi:putative membrane protein